MKFIHSHTRKDQIVINIPTDEFAAAYFKLLDQKLEKSYIFDRQTDGTLFRFKGSMFRFVWNGWNLFNTVSRGEIEFADEEGFPYIKHKIYLTETIIIALLFNIIPLFSFFFERKLSLIIFAAIWILYLIVYLVTIFRFNSFVSELLMQVNLEHGYKYKTDRPAFG